MSSSFVFFMCNLLCLIGVKGYDNQIIWIQAQMWG